MGFFGKKKASVGKVSFGNAELVQMLGKITVQRLGFKEGNFGITMRWAISGKLENFTIEMVVEEPE